MPTDDELTQVCQEIVEESLKELPNIIGMATDRLREVRGFEREIHELIRTRRVWARILDVPGVEREAVHRIGMVRGVSVFGANQLHFGVNIAKDTGNGYLWNDKSWTRRNWPYNQIEMVVMPPLVNGAVQFGDEPIFKGDYHGIISLKGKSIWVNDWILC